MYKIVSIAICVALVCFLLYVFLGRTFEKSLEYSVDVSIKKLKQIIEDKQAAIEEKVSKDIIIPAWKDKETLFDERLIIFLYRHLERNVEISRILSNNHIIDESVYRNIELLRHHILTYSFLCGTDMIVEELPEDIYYYDIKKDNLKLSSTDEELEMKVQWSEGGYAIRNYTDNKICINQCVDFYKTKGYEIIKPQIDFGLPIAKEGISKIIMQRDRRLVVLVCFNIGTTNALTQLLPDEKNIKDIFDILESKKESNFGKLFRIRN